MILDRGLLRPANLLREDWSRRRQHRLHRAHHVLHVLIHGLVHVGHHVGLGLLCLSDVLAMRLMGCLEEAGPRLQQRWCRLGLDHHLRCCDQHRCRYWCRRSCRYGTPFLPDSCLEVGAIDVVLLRLLLPVSLRHDSCWVWYYAIGSAW